LIDNFIAANAVRPAYTNMSAGLRSSHSSKQDNGPARALRNDMIKNYLSTK